jgi:hypothetical protein
MARVVGCDHHRGVDVVDAVKAVNVRARQGANGGTSDDVEEGGASQASHVPA